jgi:hypothetical protein
MTPSRQPPARVPTLTEVVEVPVLALDLEDGSGDTGAAIVPPTGAAVPPPSEVPVEAAVPAETATRPLAASDTAPTALRATLADPASSAPSAGPPPAPLPSPRVSDLLVAGLREEPLLPVGDVLPRSRATSPVAASPAPGAAVSPSLEEQVTQRVLADLQRQVDLMLEYRLREVLAPALARVSDLLVRETRQELASTLRDIVGRAVAQELARRRTGR